MARATPQVRDGVLVYDGETRLEMVSVGSAAWRSWLDNPGTSSFRFVHQAGSFTARKEHRRRGGSYWYAYRTQGRRLRKGYLGRAQELTFQRLVEVAALLNGPQAAPPWAPMAASGGEQPPGRPTPIQDTALPPNALLATKLYMPPSRPGLVPRPHLTERLSAGLRGPLTLLVAPAGFGKTTLLAAWRAAQQQPAWPVAWLALDAEDNDLARFLRYAIAAVQRLRADPGRAAPASLPYPHSSPDALLALLLNDLTTLPEDVILMLDDYHVIETAPVHRVLAFLLDHLPPRVHLVIAARADPPLALARLRARGQLTELRAADLRFTADETAAFLRHALGVSLAAEDVAALSARTEGWIAGLQLAALALQGQDSAHLSGAIAALRGTHRYILDYLADEVFEHQPEEVRRFLLCTSVLDRLSGALCEAVLKDDRTADGATDDAATDDAAPAADGQAMLERLEAANLFLVPLDDTRTWYRYHHLFADFLRARLRREHPDLAPELHRRAARWYKRHGLLPEAVDHALAARDHALAARLVEQAIPSLIWQRGETATPLRWLERLPREVARTRPRLCLDLAWVALWSGRWDAVEPWLDEAEHALNNTDRAAPSAGRGAHEVRRGHVTGRALRAEIVALRAQLARQRGELTATIALARQALDDLPADERRVRGVTTAALAGAYFWSGDTVAASQAYAEAAALSRASGTISLTLIANGRLVLIQALQGQLHQAAATYRQTCELAATYGMAATPALGVAQVGMGEVLREWNELDRAENLLRQGIAHCAEAGGRRAEVALDGYIALARVVQARGDVDGALAVLRHAETLGREHHVAQYAERVAVARARLWLTTTPGDVAAALQWADPRAEAWRMDADEMPDYVGLLERLTLARLHLVQGRRDEAAALLQRLLERAEAGGLVAVVLEVLALQARLFLEGEDVAQAMMALSQALALAQPEGSIRVFVDEGAPTVALLRYAQARGVAPAYVAALLTACGATQSASSPDAPVLVEPLSTRERELLRLLAVGLSTPEIAAQLFITAGTVRNHLKSIYRKLGVHSRQQAVERGRALGLVQPDTARFAAQ